jgi:hypothetical protein
MKIDIKSILAMPLQERFKYLRENESSLIATKKSTPHIFEMKESVFNDDVSKSALTDQLNAVTALIFETKVLKSYNEKIFQMYAANGINQHSIGLQYINLSLALNDPEDLDRYKTWNDYFSQIINKSRATDYGFFFAVKEYKLIENSSVLFGANEMTPTLSIQKIDDNSILVKVVANTANWMDEQNDVLLPGSAKKSIKERKNRIPHLIDHDYSVASKVGEVQNIYEEIINLNTYIKAANVAPENIEPQSKALDYDYIINNILKK